MFNTNNFFEKINLKSNLKRYKSTLIYSFIVGLLMGSLPFIYKTKENFRIQKLIQEQRRIEIQNKEKICKEDNSDYQKFLSLGFPKTAIENFHFYDLFFDWRLQNIRKKKLMKMKILLKLLFLAMKIIILKSISMMVGILKKNTLKKKFVHGKLSLLLKIAI